MTKNKTNASHPLCYYITTQVFLHHQKFLTAENQSFAARTCISDEHPFLGF